MLKINDEIYQVTGVNTSKYNLIYNNKVVDDVYKVQLIVDESTWFAYYNIKSLDFFNNFDLNVEYLINDYIDENALEISYKGVWAEEFSFDNKVYLTKLSDNNFRLKVIMDAFIFDYHNVKSLELDTIINFEYD